mgnify:CR=1 FL=1
MIAIVVIATLVCGGTAVLYAWASSVKETEEHVIRLYGKEYVPEDLARKARVASIIAAVIAAVFLLAGHDS